MRFTSNLLLLIVVLTHFFNMLVAFQSLDLNQIRGYATKTIKFTSVPVKIHSESVLFSSRSTRDMNDGTTASSSSTILNNQLNYVTNDVRMPLWTTIPKGAKKNNYSTKDVTLLDTELWLGRVGIVAAVAIIVNEVTTHEGIVTLLSKIGTSS